PRCRHGPRQPGPPARQFGRRPFHDIRGILRLPPRRRGARRFAGPPHVEGDLRSRLLRFLPPPRLDVGPPCFRRSADQDGTRCGRTRADPLRCRPDDSYHCAMRTVRWSLQLAWLGIIPLWPAHGATTPADLPSRKDLVSAMTNIAGKFVQDNPLAPAVYQYGDWDDVKKSVMPKTAYWSYTTGATLIALQRVYDITGDRALLDYSVRNNEISAEQYSFLWWETKTFGKITSTGGFGKLWRLDMLDDCGAMGAEMLDTVLRH